jgi:predicted transcriptional regulator
MKVYIYEEYDKAKYDEAIKKALESAIKNTKHFLKDTGHVVITPKEKQSTNFSKQ